MSRCIVLLLETGIVALDEQDKVIQSVRFDTASMVESYRAVKNGLGSSQLEDMLQRLKSQGYGSAAGNDEALVRIMIKHGMDASLVGSDEQLAFQEKKVSIMLNANLAPNEFEAANLLRKFAIVLSSLKVGEISAKLDLHVIQSVNALDEIDKIVNAMGARIREWYGLHFPELDAMMQSLPAYCEIVSRAGDRKNIDQAVLKDIGLQDRADDIVDAARSSKGGAITMDNLGVLQNLAEEIKHLSNTRDSLTKHLEQEMDKVAPNTKEILGATIGARMIAKVGSLDRLAMLPASTVQVIGAERALFRALKTGSRPPKHGILFQHPLVHSAPKWQRGKIARAIAAKVVIAARIDAYRGVKEPSLMGKLNERIEEIRQKYKEPVEREERFEERPKPSFKKGREREREGRGDERRRRFGRRRR
ncbi:MAG: nucleolar protein 56 [Candidatus Nitrosomirales archaeon]|jgi:nucleolar protein 56